MIELKETFTIDAPLRDVWPLLADPARVAGCIPGATFDERTEDGRWRGTIVVRFGPTTVVFKGDTELTYDDAAHTCRIDGRGTDRKGMTRASADFLLSATGEATTEVTMEGAFRVSGPLDAFASAGGVHVARALIAEFAKNVTSMALQSAAHDSAKVQAGAAASAARPPAPMPVRTLNLAAILWQAFLRWLRGGRHSERPH